MMPDRLRAHCVLPLICAALLFPRYSGAQTEPWYQVELIVFSHPAGSAAEQWDATPDLIYPETSRLLTDEATLPAASTSREQAAPTASSQPTAFTILPPNQRALRNKAAAIQRSSRYQILFHEAWNQPMTDQANALPIILDRSGDEGAWPELQGTITLYVARYLYLETNLWLNTRGEYLSGSWRMPAPPLGPSSRSFEALALLEEPASALEFELLSEPESGLELASPVEPGQPQHQNISAESAVSLEPELASSAFITITDNIDALEPIYPFRHAVLLQQKRRMRSGEVHYIDHPMLGVVVTITPLPDPKSQTAPQATPQ